MRNIFVKSATFLLAVFILISCAGAQKSADGQNANLSVAAAHTDFADVQNKDWSLNGLRINGENSGFNRNNLAEVFKDVFTIHFDAERISGIGAPNRYFAPYTLGNDNALTISTIAGTLMAAFAEPEHLKEHEYFSLLQNVSRWDLADGNLLLYSVNKDNAEVVMIFSDKS